ncbi:MAG: nucleotidyltransferase domain-containing protein [Oscillospiraceae bacterium]|nr:nucleotidyltransferase domain-containing protein [Oscillospiraceae bacterium]
MINEQVIKAVNTAVNYPYITAVGVFGSYARNEETTVSDIDILYKYDDTTDDFLCDVLNYGEELENQIKSFTGSNVKVDYISFEGLRQSKNESFKQSVLNDVVWLYEKTHSNEVIF